MRLLRRLAARAELIAEYLATHPADDRGRQRIEELLELARQRREQENRLNGGETV